MNSKRVTDKTENRWAKHRIGRRTVLFFLRNSGSRFKMRQINTVFNDGIVYFIYFFFVRYILLIIEERLNK